MPADLTALGIAALGIAALGGLLAWLVALERRQRASLEASLVELASGIGLAREDGPGPWDQAKPAVVYRGRAGAEVLRFAFFPGRYRSTEIARLVGAGRPATTVGLAMPWFSICPRSAMIGITWLVGPGLRTGDAAFDARYYVGGIVAAGPLGTTPLEGPIALPDAFRAALLAAPGDVNLAFDGAFVKVSWSDWTLDAARCAWGRWALAAFAEGVPAIVARLRAAGAAV